MGQKGWRRKRGWSGEEIELLKKKLREGASGGLPLGEVFAIVSEMTDRKANSVRNYYYTELRKQMEDEEGDIVIKRQRSDFTPFTDKEIEMLMKYVLNGVAMGKSVRSCALELGEGDTSKMLRYQNKYRSMIKTHREYVCGIIEEMKAGNVPCYNPYREQAEKKEFRGSVSKESVNQALENLKRIASIDLPAFIASVNLLYEKSLGSDGNADEVNSLKQELSETNKRAQNLESQVEYYRFRLKELTDSMQAYITSRESPQDD